MAAASCWRAGPHRGRRRKLAYCSATCSRSTSLQRFSSTTRPLASEMSATRYLHCYQRTHDASSLLHQQSFLYELVCADVALIPLMGHCLGADVSEALILYCTAMARTACGGSSQQQHFGAGYAAAVTAITRYITTLLACAVTDPIKPLMPSLACGLAVISPFSAPFTSTTFYYGLYKTHIKCRAMS
jgi:hypothetical protein